MSNPSRVKSKRTGRTGYCYRFTDPATGSRTHKTFWLPEKREADRAFAEHMASREAVRIGLPDNSGWQMPYKDLAENFLRDAPISSSKRRKALRALLLRNDLSLATARDICDIGRLSAGCVRLLKKYTDEHVRKCIQRPLKQMASWAASVKLLPVNPLADWRMIPRTSEVGRRRALRPPEMHAILEAAGEIDALAKRPYPLAIVFETLLLTGNRPGAVFGAKVGDLAAGRIELPPGNGNKRNGAACLPRGFLPDIQDYIRRRDAGPDDSLLVSPTGARLDRVNARTDFMNAATLAFVKMCWQKETTDVEPIEGSTLIARGKVRGFDGAPPRDPKKIELRIHHIQRVEEAARAVEPQVRRLLHGVTLYSLKHTHVSWARRLVSPDSVRVQVGHAPRDVEERHYLDVSLVDPHESAEAVWDVLTGRRSLKGEYRSEARRVAVGAESDLDLDHVRPAQPIEVDLNVDLIRRDRRADTSVAQRRGAEAAGSHEVTSGGRCRIRTGDILLVRQAL